MFFSKAPRTLFPSFFSRNSKAIHVVTFWEKTIVKSTQMFKLPCERCTDSSHENSFKNFKPLLSYEVIAESVEFTIEGNPQSSAETSEAAHADINWQFIVFEWQRFKLSQIEKSMISEVIKTMIC